MDAMSHVEKNVTEIKNKFDSGVLLLENDRTNLRAAIVFLKKNLKDYKPLTPGQEKKQWDDVDRKVSPSVLMILSRG